MNAPSADWTRRLKAIATSSALESPGVLMACSTDFLMETLVDLTEADMPRAAVMAELEWRAGQ